jgi:hypothetical protein
VVTDIKGNIQRLGGVEGMANWLGGPFQWLRPLVHHKNTTINNDSARLGLNRPGNGEAVAFFGVHFFGIMASGGF